MHFDRNYKLLRLNEYLNIKIKNKKTIGVSISFFVFLFVLATSFVGVPIKVKADTGNPVSLSASYNTVTSELNISGTYANAPVASKKRPGFAVFINGNTPLTMSIDNQVHLLPQGTSSGNFSDTHNLGFTPNTVCVVLYDIHSQNGVPLQGGGHSVIPAGPNHNGDNSYEESDNSFGSGCITLTVIEPKCELVINKAVDKAEAQAGDVLTYTLSFKNVGNGDCTGGGVKVQDVVDTGLTFISSSSSNNVTPGYNDAPLYQSLNRTLTWNADTLTPSESGSITWQASVNNPSTCGSAIDIPNSARISAKELSNFNIWVISNIVHTSLTKVCPAQPKLAVIKTVINDSGGTKQVSDFPLFVNNTSVVSGQVNTFSPGTYTVSETQKTGYSVSFSGDCNSQGVVVLSSGDNKTCTITNNDISTQLFSISGIVFNDKDNDSTSAPESGESGLSGWLVFIDADNDKFFDNGEIHAETSGDGNYLFNNLSSGNYSICQIAQNNWAQTYPLQVSCHNVTVGNSSNSTNINFGNFQNLSTPTNATLTVTKVVVNDNGGIKQVSDFVLFVNSTAVVSGQANQFASGIYAISESNQNGYAMSIGGDCSAQGVITLASGQNKFCVITNNDISSKLTVNKIVVNNNSGNKQVSDFTLKVDSTTVVSGTQNNFSVGTHVVSEIQHSDYTALVTGDCAANGSIVLNLGDIKTCTIVNDDIPPSIPPSSPSTPTTGNLTVIKVVINDNGGTKQVANFPLLVNNLSVVSGQTNTFNQGTYTVSETNQAGYSSSFGGDCNSQGVVILQAGSSKTCIITNNDNLVPSAPILSVVKSIEQDFTSPGSTLNYKVVVTNVSNVIALNMLLVDNLPSGLAYSDPPGGLTKSWSLGNMAPGASQTINYTVLVGNSTLPGTYRNLAQVNAANYQTIYDSADIEVRRSQVLGFITLPSTGGPNKIILQIIAFASVLTIFIAGVVLLATQKENKARLFSVSSNKYHKIFASRMKKRR